jgi:hypothetical protein
MGRWRHVTRFLWRFSISGVISKTDELTSQVKMSRMRPARIEVTELLSSRYDTVKDHTAVRPQEWDERVAGLDVVRVSAGHTVRLRSSAMQSPPKPGWVLMLTDGNEADGYAWTLYGLSRAH